MIGVGVKLGRLSFRLLNFFSGEAETAWVGAPRERVGNNGWVWHAGRWWCDSNHAHAVVIVAVGPVWKQPKLLSGSVELET